MSRRPTETQPRPLDVTEARAELLALLGPEWLTNLRGVSHLFLPLLPGERGTHRIAVCGGFHPEPQPAMGSDRRCRTCERWGAGHGHGP